MRGCGWSLSEVPETAGRLQEVGREESPLHPARKAEEEDEREVKAQEDDVATVGESGEESEGSRAKGAVRVGAGKGVERKEAERDTRDAGGVRIEEKRSVEGAERRAGGTEVTKADGCK